MEPSSGPDAATQATLKFIKDKLTLSDDALQQLDGVKQSGLTLPVMRAMGHEGLKELGLCSAVDRAKILVTNGDAPLPKVESNYPKKPRTFEVKRADITQVKDIDPINQTFGATVLFEFVVRNGADDPDFWPDDGLDECDQFRFPYPPARWFWHNQVYLVNALSFEMLEQPKVVRMPETSDLTCIFYVTGEFQERYELETFPFDVQTLTIILEIKCAKEGPLPVEIFIPKEAECRKAVEVKNFHKDNVWMLSRDVTLEHGETGVGTKRYPALKCSFTVGRRSAFYLWQVRFSPLLLLLCACSHPPLLLFGSPTLHLRASPHASPFALPDSPAALRTRRSLLPPHRLRALLPPRRHHRATRPPRHHHHLPPYLRCV